MWTGVCLDVYEGNYRNGFIKFLFENYAPLKYNGLVLLFSHKLSLDSQLLKLMVNVIQNTKKKVK